MPSVSKNQQAAAAIALKAKKEGKIDDLPKKSSSHQMATSMSVEELEKFAGTKRKGLPKEKNESKSGWAGSSLSEIFKEEMLDTEEPGEEISSDKNRRDQLKAAGNETEDDTGWDEYDALWTQKASTNPTQGGNASGMNAMGVARVGFESKISNPNSLDILFEQDYDVQTGIARSEMLGAKVEEIEEEISEDVMRDLDSVHTNPTTKLFSYKDPEPPSKQLAIELVGAYLSELSAEGRTMRTLEDVYGDMVPKNKEHRWPSPLIDFVAKDLGEQIWIQWIYKNELIEPRTDTDRYMLEDMVKFLVGYYYKNGDHPSAWTPEELIKDFEYEYSVSPYNKKDLDVAQKAIRKAAVLADKQDANETHGAPTSEAVFDRRKNLADVLLEKKTKKSKEVDEQAMLGGVSNGTPAPGHRAKANESKSFEYFAQGKGHRVDVSVAREELIQLANEVVQEIEKMYLDDSDRKTERMTQNKLGNIYKYLEKLKKLAN